MAYLSVMGELVDAYCELVALVQVMERYMVALHQGQCETSNESLKVARRLVRVADELGQLIEKLSEEVDVRVSLQSTPLPVEEGSPLPSSTKNQDEGQP